MRTLKRVLIVSASGESRVVARPRGLRWDEFGFNLTITIPDTWGKVIGAINVELPEPDMPDVRVALQ